MRKRPNISLIFIFTVCIVLLTIFYGFNNLQQRRVAPDKNNTNPPSEHNRQQQPSPGIITPVPAPPTSAPTPSPIPTPIPTPSITNAPIPSPTKKPVKKLPSIEGAVGSYETHIMDKSGNRTKNIKLAAQSINGYVVKPGETFSFNGVVGARTVEKGYLEAKVIVNGKFVDDTGGGICQLSSTLYNAVQKSGLKVVERHPHSRKVAYVKEGEDAAVSYGFLDFKFKNTKEYPVEIRAGISQGRVYAFIVKPKEKTPLSY